MPFDTAPHIDAIDSLPRLLHRALGFGPAFAIIDPDHPELAGTPGLPQGCAVVLRWTEATALPAPPEGGRRGEGRVEGHFPFTWAFRSEPRELRVPWDALLAVHGHITAHHSATATGRDVLPSWLPGGVQGLDRLMAELTGQAAQPWPFWLPPEEAELDVSLQRESKPEALRELLTGPTGLAELFIDLGAPGLQVPHCLVSDGQHGVVMLGDAGLLSHLIIDAEAVSWRMHLSGEPTRRYRVPWSAVIGMKEPAEGQGWFWPAALPAQVVASLAMPGVTLQTPTTGLPLHRPVPGIEAALAAMGVLPEPPLACKRAAFARARRMGDTIVLFDRQDPKVRLPGTWNRGPVVALHLRKGAAKAQVSVGELDVRLHDATGRPVRVRVPWTAVFALRSLGPLSVHDVWPADYPASFAEAVAEALAVPHLQRPTELLQPRPTRSPLDVVALDDDALQVRLDLSARGDQSRVVNLLLPPRNDRHGLSC